MRPDQTSVRADSVPPCTPARDCFQTHRLSRMAVDETSVMHRARHEMDETAQVEEQEISHIRQTAREACDEHRCQIAAPDEDGTDRGGETDPKQVEAMLVDHGAGRVMMGAGQHRRIDRIGDRRDGIGRIAIRLF